MTAAEAHLTSGTESRARPRTSLFLAATILGAGVDWPVKLRNMSAEGALAEGPYLPKAGDRVSIARGNLHMQATVAWSQPGRCGLQFEGMASVADWMKEKAAEVGSAGQRRTDLYQAQIRRGDVPPAHELTERAKPKDTPACVLRERMAEELEYVQRGLEQMADQLVADSYILARHAGILQQFDVLGQILGHVRKLTVADDPPAEAGKIGMVELRRRLLR